MTHPDALPARWRELADAFARYGQLAPAELLRSVAGELEAARVTEALEGLSLQEAAQASGLSYSGIEKAVRAGRIPNAGEPGKPRILRRDLPRKIARPSGPSLAEQVTAAGLRGLPKASRG